MAAKVAIDIREPFLHWVTLLSQWDCNCAWGSAAAEAQGAHSAVRHGQRGRERGQLPRCSASSDGTRVGSPRHCQDSVRHWPGWRPHSLGGLAFAEAIGGDRGQAKVMLGEAASNDFDIPYGPAWLGTMCHWAAVAAELGDVDAAATLYTKLRPWKERFGTGGPMPVHGVSHALGRLAALLGQPRPPSNTSPAPRRIHQTCAHLSTPPKPACTGVRC